MPSVYLKCDICGAEYDGEEYGRLYRAHSERRMTGIPSGLRKILAEEARALGWTGWLDYDWVSPHKGGDRRSFCPQCSESGRA